MVYNYAKLALLTGFAFMAEAKKYGYRGNTDGGVSQVDDGEFVKDSWDSQKDSRNPGIDMAKRLKKNGKKWKKKNKKGCNEKDFSKGVLASVIEAMSIGADEEGKISLHELGEAFDAIVGTDFDSEDNRAFERGADFGDKKLYSEDGCRAECREAPWAEGCQSCCVSYTHQVEWNCDSEDPAKPIAKCCTEWTEECYTTDSEDNNNHACKDCGYGRSYGGYGGYGRSYGGYGRRRAGAGYGRPGNSGRRRDGRSAGYGRGGRRRGGDAGYGSGYGRYRG